MTRRYESPFRAEPHRFPAHRLGAHRPLQLPVRPPPWWGVRAAHRGHRRGPLRGPPRHLHPSRPRLARASPGMKAPIVGGPYGPYRQSERRPAIRPPPISSLARRRGLPLLLQRGAAGGAARRAGRARHAALRSPLPGAAAGEVQRRIPAGEPAALRLRVPDREVCATTLSVGPSPSRRRPRRLHPRALRRSRRVQLRGGGRRPGHGHHARHPWRRPSHQHGQATVRARGLGRGCAAVRPPLARAGAGRGQAIEASWGHRRERVRVLALLATGE